MSVAVELAPVFGNESLQISSVIPTRLGATASLFDVPRDQPAVLAPRGPWFRDHGSDAGPHFEQSPPPLAAR
jgi:hypothetical protein